MSSTTLVGGALTKNLNVTHKALYDEIFVLSIHHTRF